MGPPPTGGASRAHSQTWPTTHGWSLAGPLAILTHHPRVEPCGPTRKPDPPPTGGASRAHSQTWPTTHGWSLAGLLAKIVRICHYRYSIKRWISSFKLLRVCMWGVGVYCTIGRVCVLACVLSNLTWLTLIGGERKSYGESRRVEGESTYYDRQIYCTFGLANYSLVTG